MDYAYFLRTCRNSIKFTKRVSLFHRFVFHGVRAYVDECSENWERPALTNSNREAIHLTRSGTFVPSVFSPKWNELIVPARLASNSAFRMLAFQPVVAEQIVDIAMPPLGVNPFNDYFRDNDRIELLAKLPHQTEMEDCIAQHSQMLVPNLSSANEDIVKTETKTGNYFMDSQKVYVSMSVLKEYGVHYAGRGVFVLGEEVFTVIAPLLDLDYYTVGVLDLRRRTVFGPEGRRTVQWPEE